MRLFGVLMLAVILTQGVTVGAWSDDAGAAPDGISTLLGLIDASAAPETQSGLLAGINQALAGKRSSPMPKAWPALAVKLKASANAEVRGYAEALSVLFGDATATAAARALVMDKSAPAADRSRLLAVLLHAHPKDLAGDLQALLPDPTVGGLALCGLADYDDAKTPAAIVAVYASLPPAARRDAVNTLSSRLPYAQAMAAAVGAGQIPAGDVTSFCLRQLRLFKQPDLDKFVVSVIGDLDSEKFADRIAKLKATATAAGFLDGADAGRGRTVFARTCAQCHTLFDAGGKVGPELTGLNRGDLDYVLANVVDPSAVLGADYKLAILRTKDGRIITGMVREDDPDYVTIQTESVQLTVPRAEIEDFERTEKSTMPDGLLNRLKSEEFRDLLTYLKSTAQIPAK